MNIAVEQVINGLAILSALFSFAAAAFMWRLKGEFATKKELIDVVQRVEKTENDMTGMKARLESLPDHDDLADLRESLAGVDKSVGVVATEVQGLKAVLERVERPLNLLVEHHLKGASK